MLRILARLIDHLHLKHQFDPRMEVTDIDPIKDFRKVGQSQLVLFVRVAQTEKSLCDNHRQMAILRKRDLVYSHCLEGFLLNTSLSYVTV